MVETRMDDLRAVMDAAESRRALVVATYEAAAMAMVYAATSPERVAGLVIYHATAKGTRSSDYAWAPSDEEHASWIEQIRARWGQTDFAAADLRPSSATTVVRGELGRFRGRELDTAGDGFFAGTS